MIHRAKSESEPQIDSKSSEIIGTPMGVRRVRSKFVRDISLKQIAVDVCIDIKVQRNIT